MKTDQGITPRLASRSFTRRRMLAALGIGGVALGAGDLLAACAPAVAPAPPSPSGPSGKIVVLTGVVVEFLDPTLSINLIGDANVLYNLFDTLYQIQDGKPVPSLATAHEISADQLTHTFTIRQGVKFHDGSPLTPEDVAFTFARGLDASTVVGNRARVPEIETSQVQGDKLILKLKRADPIIENKLAYTVNMIVPKAHINAVGAKVFGSTAPVGSGPFKFVSWVPGDAVTLEANPDYWGPKPRLKSLVFKNVPEPASRLALLQSGAANLAYGLDPSHIDPIQAAGFRVLSGRSGRAANIRFNPENAHFKDLRVRQAFQMAIDREAIIRTIYRGHATISATFAFQGVTGYDPAVPPVPYDPPKATQLLQQAGWDSNYSFNFDAPRGRWVGGEDASAAIVANLNAVGVKARLNLQEESLWSREITRPSPHQMYLTEVVDTFGDQSTSLTTLTTSAPRGSWSDPELDKMLTQASGLAGAERTAAFIRLYRYIYDTVAAIPLYEYRTLYPLGPGVEWQPSEGLPYMRFVSASQTGKEPTL